MNPYEESSMQLEESYAESIVMKRVGETLRVAKYSIASSLTAPKTVNLRFRA